MHECRSWRVTKKVLDLGAELRSSVRAILAFNHEGTPLPSPSLPCPLLALEGDGRDAQTNTIVKRESNTLWLSIPEDFRPQWMVRIEDTFQKAGLLVTQKSPEEIQDFTLPRMLLQP